MEKGSGSAQLEERMDRVWGLGLRDLNVREGTWFVGGSIGEIWWVEQPQVERDVPTLAGSEWGFAPQQSRAEAISVPGKGSLPQAQLCGRGPCHTLMKCLFMPQPQPQALP